MRISTRPLPVLLTALAVTLGVVLLYGVGGSRAAVSTTLHASVGPDLQISLAFDDGSGVSALPAGPYTVLVDDKGTAHNFHLYGLGVDRATSIESTEQASWAVTLADGAVYQFQCDRHPSSLNGSFVSGNLVATVPAPGATPTPTATPTVITGSQTVTSFPSAPTTTTPSAFTKTLVAKLAPIPVATEVASFFTGTFTAISSARGKVSVSSSGHPARTIPKGTYHLVILDGDARTGVTIRQVSGGKFHYAFTSKEFVGRKSTAIQFLPGKWKIYSTGHPGATARFVIVKD